MGWEHRQCSAIDPSKCPEKRGGFEDSSSLVRQTEAAVTSTGEPIASVQRAICSVACTRWETLGDGSLGEDFLQNHKADSTAGGLPSRNAAQGTLP